MELFKGQSLLEFTERFKTDLDCEEYINLDSSGEETHRKQDGITPSGEW